MLPTTQQINSSFEDGFTQSEMMERCNCPRKHLFRYILNLKKQGSFSWALVTGAAVHKLLEEHYTLLRQNGSGLTTLKTIEFDFESDVILQPEQYDEYLYWKMVAGLLVHQHNEYYQETDSKIKVHNVEVPIDIEYRGFRMKGMIDLVAEGLGKGRPWIMDHKTTSKLDDIKMEGWQFRFQFLFYSWLWTKLTDERPAGTFVNLLKKPQEKRSTRNNESIEDFVRRIATNMLADPANYFMRLWVPLDNEMLERFERYTLDPIITQFQMIQMALDGEFNQQITESLLLLANTDYCISWNSKCEFLDLCKNNFKDYAMEFIQRTVKHPELEHAAHRDREAVKID